MRQTKNRLSGIRRMGSGGFLMIVWFAWLVTTTTLSAAQPDGLEKQVLRRAGDDGVASYRIPGLVTTNQGTVVACFDLRWQNAGDLPGDIDVGVMRSSDGGRSWGPLIRALDLDAGAAGARGNGVGDAAMLVDRETGKLWMVALWSHGDRAWHGSGPGLSPDETGQCVITHSSDEGQTWAAPVSITPQVKQPEWRLLFNGPGAGLQLRDGTLVLAAQYRDAAGKPSSCFLFSKDHGEQWQLSPAAFPDQPPTSEAQLAELRDGSLLMTMRNESRGPQRMWARWTWQDQPEQGEWSDRRSALEDPVCMAGLLGLADGRLVISHCNSRKRERLTVRSSDDGGLNWNAGRVIEEGPAAYSCLTQLPDGRIGILYETGRESPYEALVFASFPPDWLEQRQPAKPAAPLHGHDDFP